MSKIIGLCGSCGGDVVSETVWHGGYDLPPRCRKCYAEPVKSDVPVLAMEKGDCVFSCEYD